MKKIVAALVLIILSVNLFILIPWQVPLYRGEYVHVLQSPGKTEVVMYPCKGDSRTDHVTDPWSARNLETILDRVLCEGDYLAFYGVSEQVTRQIPRLDKLNVPSFSDGEIEVINVSITGGTVNYQLRDQNSTAFALCQIWVGCAEDCKECARFDQSFQKRKELGQTEQYLDTKQIKAVRFGRDIDAFGEVDGVRFHANFTVREEKIDRELLTGIRFQTYRNDHNAMLPYRLAESGRILSVFLFATGTVLLVLGLLPLRKKQTVPDG